MTPDGPAGLDTPDPHVLRALRSQMDGAGDTVGDIEVITNGEGFRATRPLPALHARTVPGAGT